MTTESAERDPHKIVLMMYDGALEAIGRARPHMGASLSPKLSNFDKAAKANALEKGQLLAKAARIVEEGLKASLDLDAGGPLAQRLTQLYDYCVMRLLQASLRNDQQALEEVNRILADLRSAWALIGAAQSEQGDQTNAQGLPDPAAVGAAHQFERIVVGAGRRISISA